MALSDNTYLRQISEALLKLSNRPQQIIVNRDAGEALTRVNDTNVTLTLGGSPTVSLLAATSLTLGWTGTLSLTRGGTAKALTAVNGGIVWTDADSMEISAAGTSGQVLQSNGAAAPTFVTALANGITATTQSAGTNNTTVATTAYADNAVDKQEEVIAIACSDLTTDLAVAATVGYIRMPFAMTLTSVRASVLTAPTDADLIIDIHETGSSIFTTDLLTIDDGDTTSVGSGTTPNITDASLADNALIEVDITQIGSTVAGAGLIVYLIGTRT